MARRITHPLRGEVWLVNFDPTLGAEIQKTRPALVIQNDTGNRVSPITIVAAITSTLKRAYPFQVFLPAGDSQRAGMWTVAGGETPAAFTAVTW